MEPQSQSKSQLLRSEHSLPPKLRLKIRRKLLQTKNLAKQMQRKASKVRLSLSLKRSRCTRKVKACRQRTVTLTFKSLSLRRNRRFRQRKKWNTIVEAQLNENRPQAEAGRLNSQMKTILRSSQSESLRLRRSFSSGRRTAKRTVPKLVTKALLGKTWMLWLKKPNRVPGLPRKKTC